jgi:hypothetical protein
MSPIISPTDLNIIPDQQTNNESNVNLLNEFNNTEINNINENTAIINEINTASETINNINENTAIINEINTASETINNDLSDLNTELEQVVEALDTIETMNTSTDSEDTQVIENQEVLQQQAEAIMQEQQRLAQLAAELEQQRIAAQLEQQRLQKELEEKKRQDEANAKILAEQSAKQAYDQAQANIIEDAQNKKKIEQMKLLNEQKKALLADQRMLSERLAKLSSNQNNLTQSALGEEQVQINNLYSTTIDSAKQIDNSLRTLAVEVLKSPGANRIKPKTLNTISSFAALPTGEPKPVVPTLPLNQVTPTKPRNSPSNKNNANVFSAEPGDIVQAESKGTEDELIHSEQTTIFPPLTPGTPGQIDAMTSVADFKHFKDNYDPDRFTAKTSSQGDKTLTTSDKKAIKTAITFGNKIARNRVMELYTLNETKKTSKNYEVVKQYLRNIIANEGWVLNDSGGLITITTSRAK